MSRDHFGGNLRRIASPIRSDPESDPIHNPIRSEQSDPGFVNGRFSVTTTLKSNSVTHWEILLVVQVIQSYSADNYDDK